LTILSFSLCLASCGEGDDGDEGDVKSAKMEAKPIEEILSDSEMPVLYDPANEFLEHFSNCGRPGWITKGRYSESALVNINEAGPHLVERQMTTTITIRTRDDKDLSGLSFIEARELAISLLPTVPPLKSEEAPRYPHKALTFSQVSEQAHLILIEGQPTIVYSAKFESIEKKPTWEGKEGFRP